MSEPAQIATAEGYLDFVADRLRAEGFVISRSGKLGELTMALVARRRGGGLRRSSTLYVFVSLHEALAPRGIDFLTADSVVPFAVAALDAHATEGTDWAHLLHGDTIVVPVVVTRGGIGAALKNALASLHLRRGHCSVLPAVVDLSQGAVHVLRRTQDLGRDGPNLLEYIWWLLTPRLVEHPRARPRSPIGRVALLTLAMVALLAVGTTIYSLWQPEERLYLVTAVDSTLHQIAYLHYGAFHDGTELITVDARNYPIARRAFPGTAWLIGLHEREVTYFSCDPPGGDSCAFWRSPIHEGPAQRIVQIDEAPSRARLSPDGTRIAFSKGGDADSRVFLVDPAGNLQPALGTRAGDHHPSWFPDGKHLALLTYAPDGGPLVSLELDTGARIEIAPGGHQDAAPSVSPDGQRIAFYRVTRHAFGDHGGRDTSEVGDLLLLSISDHRLEILMQDISFTAPPGWVSNDEIVFNKWADNTFRTFVYDLGARETRRLTEE